MQLQNVIQSPFQFHGDAEHSVVTNFERLPKREEKNSPYAKVSAQKCNFVRIKQRPSHLLSIFKWISLQSNAAKVSERNIVFVKES